MKKFTYLAFTFLLSLNLSAQFYGFEEATVVTNEGETINCLLERTVTYDYKIGYKMNQTSSVKYFKIPKIKSITTAEQSYERISMGKKHRMMKLAVDGTVKLYTQIEILEESEEIRGGFSRSIGREKTTYVLEKDGEYIEIDQKNFKDLSAILTDCESLSEKLEGNRYELKQIEGIVKTYNTCQ